MRAKVLSQEEFVLQNVVAIARCLMQREVEQHSSGLELSLVELVREQMRSLARESEGDQTANLLEAAIAIVQKQVQGRLQEDSVQFNFDSYLASVRRTLKFLAREIAQLGERLNQSRKMQRLGERRRLISQSQVPFEVAEVGLRGAIEGLFAFPLTEVCVVDVEQVQPPYQVQGEWFPFLVTAESQSLEFVVDDDGSIFVATENLPERLLELAGEGLMELVNQLYTHPGANL
ncbi:hypothetical protein H6G00_22325 [Leptolyngbya sp. FACHB-541]|uniref:hypothetical protein n=1 Tax=Leptolyngbya sp. FACHB-541 TaxID=2692810 RepID=UPI0016821E9E|nr:hypothetical protein [Leptolyngbya sp. FACHB-541]MBD1999314.1 hypothetical protein [Leptolyngbya sp. FACHB-541]